MSVKEFSQVGWFNPQSRRFEYTDIKDDRMRRGQGDDGYTVPVFAVDKDTANRLQITLESPGIVPAVAAANKQIACATQIAVLDKIEDLCVKLPEGDREAVTALIDDLVRQLRN
jgi:hypothetical protein